jgi:hypothetical protein
MSIGFFLTHFTSLFFSRHDSVRTCIAYDPQMRSVITNNMLYIRDNSLMKLCMNII